MRKKTKPSSVLGFDSEDDGKGNPFLWCYTHDDGSWWTRHRGDALTYLENMAKDERVQAEAWATNLEYDIVNLFGSERIAETSLRFGRSALCGASWRGVNFRDTVRHLPVGVETLGEALGFRKVEGRMFEAGRTRTFARYLRRCQRDASITYRTAKRLHETYAALGARPRMTLASTALAIWRDRFWKREVSRPNHELWSAALDAYHGGRTQAFAVGKFDHVTVIDVASMFPWAMMGPEFPLPWGLFRRIRPGDAPKPNGFYRVRITSNDERPSLPVRGDEGTIYPRGSWVAWYVGCELLHAASRGVTVETLGGFEFHETCDPFPGYVRAMYRRKQRARGLDRTLYKILLNGLYGKFGQQGQQVRAIPLDKLLTMSAPPEDWRAWCGLAVFTVDQAPPPWGNNVWAAIITARARVRLAQEIERLVTRGCRPLYCDTDSVFYQGPPQRYPARARRIGDFEVRGRYRALVVVGKKEYGLDLGRGRWDLHAKGVPLSERKRYLTDGVAEFDRPVKIREGARTGETVNVWRRVRKVRRLDLRERARGTDGALPVPSYFE